MVRNIDDPIAALARQVVEYRGGPRARRVEQQLVVVRARPWRLALVGGEVGGEELDVVDAVSLRVRARARDQGSLALEPEESENITAGLVFEATFIPPEFGELTFTADWWRVKQENIVGIFGDDNQILLDYALRLQGSSNPAVVRDTPTAQQTAAFNAAASLAWK